MRMTPDRTQRPYNRHTKRATIRSQRKAWLRDFVMAEQSIERRCHPETKRLGSTMNTFVSRTVWSFLIVAAFLSQEGFGQKANLN